MRKKAFRSALAVLLAFCLMFSTVGTALAAGTAGGNDSTDVTWTEVNTLSGLQDAFKEGGNIKLAADIALTEYVSVTANVTLNLNGHSITANTDTWREKATDGSANDCLIAVRYGGSLTIEGEGNIDGSTLGENAKMYTIKMGVSSENNKSNDKSMSLTVNGGNITGVYAAISGNGLRKNTNITINGGYIKAVNSSGGVGIYHPQEGNLTINGGTINGATAVYFCAGVLVINGGTLIGTGEKKDHDNGTTGGWVATGEALVICNRNTSGSGYGAVEASVTGGTFTSVNNDAVGSYVSTSASDSGHSSVTGFISGGEFKSADGAIAGDLVASDSGEKITNTTPESYVSLGDSMTNGYGMNGYYPNDNGDPTVYQTADDIDDKNQYGYKQNAPGAWPTLVANEMGWNLTNLSISGMRPEELHAILDPTYEGDLYTKHVFLPDDEINVPEDEQVHNGSEQRLCRAAGCHFSDDTGLTCGYTTVHNDYIDSITNADVISIHLGTNNFGTILTNRLIQMMGLGDGWSIYDDVNLGDQIDDPEYKALYESIKADIEVNLEAALGEQGTDTIVAIADVMAYGVAGFFEHYAASYEIIKELNPDATIIIVGVSNPLEGTSITVDETTTIDASAAFEIVTDAINSFLGAYLGDNVYFADIEELDIMVDAMGRDEMNKVFEAKLIDSLAEMAAPVIKSMVAQQAGGQVAAMFTEEVVENIFINYLNDKTDAYVIAQLINSNEATVQQGLAAYDTYHESDPTKVPAEAVQAAALRTVCRTIYGMYTDNIKPAVVKAAADNNMSLTTFLSMFGGGGMNLDITKLDDPATQDILHVYTRCILAEGIGIHPSEKGHEQIAAAVLAAIEDGYTGEDLAQKNLLEYANKAYVEAYQQALAEGKIDELSSYIDIAIEAVKTAKGVAGSDMVKAELTEELKKSYELLLNELDLAIADLEEIKALVNNATDVDTAWADILALEDNLNAHYDNIMELAAELEILSDLALSDLNAVVNYYTALVKSIADEAYAWVANGVEEFNAEYAAWVEEMGLLADEVDPALGAAVRKFLTETPADSLAILYAYGDEAANKLFIDAAAAAEDAYVILSALASALAANGEDIYDALLASDEYNAIKADIEDLLVKIEGLYEYAKTHPVSAALYYEQIIPEAEAELGELYGLLYTAILNAMDQVDPTLAPMVDAAIDALLEVLGVAENAGAAYGDWLLGHTDAMAGELLDAFLANAEELLTVACPIIDAIIWAALAELENFVDGVIDTVETEINKQIAELEKTLEDLKAELENAADELKAEIEAQIKVVEDKIAELKALLEENIFENLSAVLKALDELQTEVEELIQIAKDAALDAVAGALGDVADALEALDEALTNWFGEAYEELKAVIGEWADELLDAIVDAAKEYAPELADAIYEYLYNNPEEVINFVKTYGPYVLDLAEKYGDEVLAVIGAALVMYGDELVAYIVENHEAILSNLVAWIDVHGENTAELLQVYAEALGLCDAVREQIAELEAALEDLKAELENASEEVKAEIEKQIAIIEAQIEALKDKLAELEAALNELIADIGATIEEVKAEIEAIVEKIEATIEEIKAEIETVIEEVKAAVEEAVQATIEEIDAIVEKALTDLEGLVEELKVAAAEAAEEIIALIQEIIYDATHGEYTITEDSSYVAIGDGVGYAELLADYLAELVKTEGANYEYTSTILAEKGSTIEDAADIIAANLGTIASADLISIGYGNDTFANQAINAMMNLMVYGVPTAYDWVALLGEDAAEYAQMALVDVYTKLVEQGFADVMIPTAKASLADSMMAAVETYAYNVAVYALYLPEVINAIHEINPDALVVIVGMSNPFAGTTFTYEDMAINVGEYVDYIVHAANIHGVTYATLSENVVYVPAPEAESTVSGQTVELGLAFVLEYLTGKIDFATTAVGHEYILEQIENALTITVEKKTGLWGDADSNGIVDPNDATWVLEYYVGLRAAEDLDLNVCDVDGNGTYDPNDATLILEYYVGLRTKFPVEE